MKNLWDPIEANKCKSELEQRVYSSRLLGRDATLVLHGGGNTSVKIRERNLLGEEAEILYVKGSGWDLETIQAEGFAPVRLDYLLQLAKVEKLSDPEMVNELATQVTRAGAPAPSVETILHAVLPHKFVDHTHADAVLAITNSADGETRIREIYGDDVVVVPYVMPGFDLAKVCAAKFAAEAKPATLGMVLMQHGIFSFGATAEESYGRMIALVDRAETYLKQQKAWDFSLAEPDHPEKKVRLELAALRRDIAVAAGSAVVMSIHSDPKCRAFARSSVARDLSQRGPATPDHILRTKRFPMLGRDVRRVCGGLPRLFYP